MAQRPTLAFFARQPPEPTKGKWWAFKRANPLLGRRWVVEVGNWKQALFMKGKANFDVYLAGEKKQEFTGSKTTVSHRLARTQLESRWLETKGDKHMRDIGLYVCTSIRGPNTCMRKDKYWEEVLWMFLWDFFFTPDQEAITRQSVCTCSCVSASGQDIQTITSTPRAKPWFHHENHSNQLQMPHHPTRLNLSEHFPIKEIPSLGSFLFFNSLLYNSSVSKTVQLRYEAADTQTLSNKKRGGGMSKTTDGTSLKKEKKSLNTQQVLGNIERRKEQKRVKPKTKKLKAKIITLLFMLPY